MKIYSTKDIAEMYKVSRISVTRWIRKGQLPASKCGRIYVITEDDLTGFEPPKPGRPKKFAEY